MVRLINRKIHIWWCSLRELIQQYQNTTNSQFEEINHDQVNTRKSCNDNFSLTGSSYKYLNWGFLILFLACTSRTCAANLCGDDTDEERVGEAGERHPAVHRRRPLLALPRRCWRHRTAARVVRQQSPGKKGTITRCFNFMPGYDMMFSISFHFCTVYWVSCN